MAAVPMPPGGPLGGVAAGSSPLDTDPLQRVLCDRFGIEVPIGAWPVPAAESSRVPIRVIRISAAIYNDEADLDRLVEALGELGTA